ncbi:MAG: hypothetical protein KTR25_14175 [Myxococcales bacterium]|nr:hypothetical protein [Myxococcales bacterium]
MKDLADDLVIEDEWDTQYLSTKTMKDVTDNLSVDSEWDNPYVSARRVWNSHTGALVARQTMWQVMALGSWFVTALAIGGLIYFANRGEYIPYIVEVDTLGQVRFAGVLAPIEDFDEKMVESTVRNFIFNARLVTQDEALQSNAILTVFAHLERGTDATGKMRSYMEGRTNGESVTVEVAGVLQTGGQTWQVEWNEFHYGLRGKRKKSTRMRANLSVEKKNIANLTDRDVARNPLGLFVSEFSWARLD